MNFKKIVLAAAALLVLLVPFSSRAEGPSSGVSKLTVFISPTCHRCIQIKSELMPKIEKEFRGIIEIEYRDTSEIENYKAMIGLRDKYRPEMQIAMPVFYMEGKLMSGEESPELRLRAFIHEGIANSVKSGDELANIDLVAYFKAFTPLAIIGAGLIDGINPCAFTVIVFFISFLALQGYRRRELVFIGLAFIFAVFLTYLLLGVGIFGFLYRMRHFWIAVKAFNLSIGVFSVSLGCLAVYDLIKFNKTKDTEGLVLQLPVAIKNRIHHIIGLHYRKPRGNEAEQEAPRKQLASLIISALVTGFLVSILEAVCTGQTYLPTISFILKTTQLKLKALAYLLVYNLMFVLPLLVIFMAALYGVTSKQFADLLKKHMGLIKILMALLFFGFGIFLIWRA